MAAYKDGDRVVILPPDPKKNLPVEDYYTLKDYEGKEGEIVGFYPVVSGRDIYGVKFKDGDHNYFYDDELRRVSKVGLYDHERERKRKGAK